LVQTIHNIVKKLFAEAVDGRAGSLAKSRLRLDTGSVRCICQVLELCKLQSETIKKLSNIIICLCAD